MFRKFICYFAVAISFCSVVDMQAHPESESGGFVAATDAKLFYRAIGKGKPVLMLHGGPGLSQTYLLPEMSKLAENHLLIFYDQRGCGRSTGEINADSMTIEQFIGDIEALRVAFNYDKISLFGHSWGGLLAMHYAIAHPEHVDRLILSNSIPPSSEGLSEFMQEWVRRLAPFQAEMADIHATEGYRSGDPATIEHLQRLIFRTYCYLPEKADLLCLRASKEASINGAKVNEHLRTNVLFKSFDLRPALRSLSLKTLVIHGDADPIPVATAQNIHESIADSRFVILKNCGHFPYVEQPTEYFQALENFLKE